MVNEALEAALAWCRAVPTRPLAEDVELVVTLDVRNVEVAREILFHDRERMRVHWHELRQTIDGAADAGDAADAASLPSPAATPAVPAPAPGPRPSPPGDATPAAAPDVGGTPARGEEAAPLRNLVDGDQLAGETSVDGFSPHFDEDPDPDALRPVDVRAVEDGGLVFRWSAPAADDLVRIYRVVTNNDYFVETPDFNGVRATYDTTLAEPAWQRRTRVHVSVWVNEGPTEGAARRATARLLGRRGLVLPVRDFGVQEYEGTVVGRWQALLGQRVRIDRLDDDGSTHVLPEETQLGPTFHDERVEPGRAYEYAAYALAAVDGEMQRSEPVRARIDLTPELHLVDDLTVRPRPDGLSCDLEWTGTSSVTIFQSSVRPDRGLIGQTLESSALTRAGLGDRVPLGAREVGGNRFRIEAARFIRGASTVFFTPVTSAADQLLVGPSVEHITPLPVTEARLVERVDQQFVTFAWPEGCSHVFIYVGGDPPSESTRQPMQQVSREEYVSHGGAHLRDPLPKDGCPVHLAGVVYSDLVPHLSSPVTLAYPGLDRLRYSLRPETETTGRPGRERTHHTGRTLLTVESMSQVSGLRAVLVRRGDRLPLHKGDGDIVWQPAQRLTVSPREPFSAVVRLEPQSGWVRLVLDDEDETRPDKAVALQDPPVTQLYRGPA